MASDALGQFRDEFGCWITDHGAEFTAEWAPYDRIILNWLTSHGVRIATINDKPWADTVDPVLIREGVEELASLGVDGDAYHGFAHLQLGRLEAAIDDLIHDAVAELAEQVAVQLGRIVRELDQTELPLYDRAIQASGDLAALRQGLIGPVTLGVPDAAPADVRYRGLQRPPSPRECRLSCDCTVTLPVRMGPGREVICSEHGPVNVRPDVLTDDSMLGPSL